MADLEVKYRWHLVPLLLVSPLLAMTGAIPKRWLPLNPGPSYSFATAAYFVFSLLHWVPVSLEESSTYGWPVALAGIALNWLLIKMLIHPLRWEVPILLAWAGTDALYLLTSFNSPWLDWGLFFVYLARAITDKGTNPPHQWDGK